MDNKQNQPNSGQPTSSSSNANKGTSQPTTPSSSVSANPASGASSASDASRATTDTSRQNQQPSSAATSTDSRTGTSANTDSNRANAGGASSSQDASRKSWLDQDKWAKSLNDLPKSLKEFGNKALEQVNSLSPTQKVVGGALLVSGLSWLALRGKSTKQSTSYGGSRYTPKAESKWKASSQSVYRGSTASKHDSDTGLDKF